LFVIYEYSYSITFRIDEQWLWSIATKFAKWQHPAMRGEYAAPETTCSVFWCILKINLTANVYFL